MRRGRGSTTSQGEPENQSCSAPAGRYEPIINRNRCEAKSDCVAVCPFDVFEIRAIEDAHYAELSLIGRAKSFVKGRRTAYTPRADACQACGLCIAACSERAIRLVLRPS